MHFIASYPILGTTFFTNKSRYVHCTEVCFASFLSGGFTTMAVINPPESKLAKRTSVHCATLCYLQYI